MQDDVLSCSEARERIGGYLQGEPSPDLAAHLARCEACLAACTEAALRRPPDVQIPAGFRERLLARIPPPRLTEPPGYPWVLVAATGAFAAVGAALWWSGEVPGVGPLIAEALRRPATVAAAGGIETALALLWLWRATIVEP